MPAAGDESTLMLTVSEIASQLGGEVFGKADLVVTGFAGLDDASADDLVFISSAKWAGRWSDSDARVALVTRGVEVQGHDSETSALIVVENAEIGLMLLLEAVAAELRPAPPAGVHSDASVDPTAVVSDSASIGARAVIGPGARIGQEVVIHPGVVIGEACVVGDRTIVHPGAVIGAEGFGFRPDPETGLPRRVPHLGSVEIGSDVEIGACCCVDRGKFGPTLIGDGTKIDNLVQVAHNVKIGRGVIIAGQAGLAGSVEIGDRAVLGAQVGVAEHVKIGAGARIAATSGVLRDIPSGEDYAGTPARPARQTLREVAALRRLPELVASMPRRESS